MNQLAFQEDRPVAVLPHGQSLLDTMVQSAFVLAEDLERLSQADRDRLVRFDQKKALVDALVELGLLTDYQARRIAAGTTFGLVLGNYRILDRLGVGGMGVVFKGEHIKMRRQVAIKVLALDCDQDPRPLGRFLTEIRAIAQLHHPNIVGAFDAGDLTDNRGQVLHFFVMEYVPGLDLEEFVREQGPLAPSQACDLIHQIASALAEANKHHLVHRDIKPSNIQVTPEGQAKLLDFGLARKFSTGMTDEGALLGTVDYMAPEQVQDAHAVDTRADLYGLGGVLYWCLTGASPFPSKGSLMEQLSARLQQKPPAVRDRRPDIPVKLEEVLQKLMAQNPDDRYASPQAVMRALMPFLRSQMGEHLAVADLESLHKSSSAQWASANAGSRQYIHQILIVDDESEMRDFCKYVLQAEGLACRQAAGGQEALRMLQKTPYDLVLLDVNLGDAVGTALCRELRDQPPCPNLKIIMASGNANADIMANMLLHGADDFITKPFSVPQLVSRVKSLLRLKDAQDGNEVLKQQLLAINRDLETGVTTRDSHLLEARNALVLALASIVEHGGNETGSHLVRLQKYVHVLGAEAGRFANQIDETFIELVACCAPLHDIGNVGLPDHILMNPTKLDADERLLMQTHTTIGAEMLQKVAKNYPSATAFLQLAIDIARHHHERFDGSGYPDRLAATNIPLAARLVSICDVYDALRSRRAYKPSLSHDSTLEVLQNAAKHFDPMLFKAFHLCSGDFDRVFRDNPD